MDRTDDSSSILFGQIAEDFHNICGCERVKARRRLIKEDQTWICDQLDTDGGTLTLATGDTFDKGPTNSRVLALGQLEVVDELIDARYFLRKSSWKFELCSELQTLFYCHRLEQDIVLLHVGRQGREISNIFEMLAVHPDVTMLVQIL